MNRRTFITITAFGVPLLHVSPANAQQVKLFGIDELPKDEVTPHSGDDYEAKVEIGETDTLPTIQKKLNITARQWRKAKALLTLHEQLNKKAPGRKLPDGFIGDAEHASRASDHNPWVLEGNIGIVTAIDITHDPKNGCDANEIAEKIRANREPRVKYVIWNRRIFYSKTVSGRTAWEWGAYTKKNANPHTEHIHISVKATKEAYDSPTPWPLIA